jgi:L-alanine-DL-glutamate epimerase-like enolase superfamily enzyme
MPRIDAIALYELLGTRPHIVAPRADVGVTPAEARENLLVLTTDDGRQGVANWEDPHPDSPPASLSALVGRDPRSLFRLSGSIVCGAVQEMEPLLRDCPPLDLALLDLVGQIEGVPLWRLLGPERRKRVPVCYSAIHFEDLLDPDSTVASVVRRAQEAVAQGHRALKLKVGRGLKWMSWPECTERDAEVVRAVREAVGPDITLALDGDRGYAGYVADAADFLAEVAPVGLAFVENLVLDHETAELRNALRASDIDVPLAGGDGWDGVGTIGRDALGCPFDVLKLATCKIGLLKHLEAARFAQENGLSIAPCTSGSQIGMFAGLQLGKVVEAFSRCDCVDTRFDGYEAPGYTLVEGDYIVPDAPGLGVLGSALDTDPHTHRAPLRRRGEPRTDPT